jgi:hypothetical protein
MYASVLIAARERPIGHHVAAAGAARLVARSRRAAAVNMGFHPWPAHVAHEES